MLEEHLFFLLSTDYTDYPDKASAHPQKNSVKSCPSVYIQKIALIVA